MTAWAILRRTGTVAAAMVLALQMAGCGLLLDTDPHPTDARVFECFVTLRSAGGEEVEVSSMMTPEFLNYDYFICTGGRCPSGCDRDEMSDFVPEWESWVVHRLDEIAAISDPADPLFGSDFRTRPGPWCRVPGTLHCEERGPMTFYGVSCPPSLPAATLPECGPVVPPPPGGEPCLTVDCGTVPCEEISFGDVPTGDVASRTVTVSNCGEVPVHVQIDETVIPAPPRSDFTIPAATNLCRARTPEEERLGRELQPASVSPPEASCTFEVVFAPTEPLEHRALIRFSSDVEPRHEIRLVGNAVGGVLDVDAPETVCLSTMSGSCTVTRTIRITNLGPGAVTVAGVSIVPTPGTGFEIVAPPPPPLPVTLSGGEILDVQLRWCGPPLASSTAMLVIDTGAAVEPTVMIPLTRTTGSCPPGT